MIEAIIVDDEQKGRRMMEHLLKKYCPSVKIADSCKSVSAAYEAILKHEPQLIFLDIEMHSETGFDLLEKFDKVDFEVIFVTAYSDYAIRAFKYCALDYILKPVDFRELIKAVDRVEEKLEQPFSSKTIEVLMSNLRGKEDDHQIAVASLEGLHFLYLNQIIACEANGNYTKFFLSDNTELLVSKNLKEYESLLPSNMFLRVHHSYVINLRKVKTYKKGDGGYVIMENEMKVDISKSKKSDFLSRVVKL